MGFIERLAKKLANTDKSPVPSTDGLNRLRELTDTLSRAEAERDVTVGRLEFERLQLREMFDSVNEPVYVLDPESLDILYANMFLLKLAGEDVLSKKCFEVFCESQARCNKCFLDDFTLHDCESCVQSYSYKDRWYYCIARVIQWPVPRSERKAVLVFAVDITKQRQAEAYVQILDQSFEQMDDAVAIVQTDRICYVNTALCDLYGYTREELVGRLAAALFAGGDSERAMLRNRLYAVVDGDTREINHRGKRSDGSVFQALSTVGVVSAPTTSDIYRIYVIRDVSGQISETAGK